jgi:hypothetical protein
MNTVAPGTMHAHRTPDVALWDQYRALREQWTHEDMLVSHRVTWLILSSGLLFTAYRAAAEGSGSWLALAFPLFGLLIATLIGISIHAAMAASDEVRREFERAGLGALCPLAPAGRLARRGRWAAQALPFVFGAMWLLALAGSLRG